MNQGPLSLMFGYNPLSRPPLASMFGGQTVGGDMGMGPSQMGMAPSAQAPHPAMRPGQNVGNALMHGARAMSGGLGRFRNGGQTVGGTMGTASSGQRG